MLRIDCLLKDTDILEDLKTAVSYIGSEKAKSGEDASLRGVFNELRKAGVEVDMESVAKIYEDQLTSTGKEVFTSSEDLKYQTGSWLDNVIRNITLQKPKKGEKEIGELSPAQAVVKTISDTFSNNVTEDATTKSILKTLEDLYREGSRRLLGELPNKADNQDLRSTQELVQQALDNEQIGYRNTTDGTINNLAKIHDEVRRQIGELTKEMEATGDHDKVEQWNNYAKSLEDAQYSLLFKSKEAEKILHDSLKEGGYVKTTKEGNEVKDWEKLTGNINSYDQLREKVVEGLKKQGFSEDIGHRVADAMSKEFKELRGKILEKADKEQQHLKDTWAPKNKQDIKVKDIVQERIDKWENYKKLAEDPSKPLIFSKEEARKTLDHAIVESDITKKGANGEPRLDIDKLSNTIDKIPDIKQIAIDYLKKQGHSDEVANHVSDAIEAMYHDMFDKVAEHVKGKRGAIEKTWDKPMGTQNIQTPNDIINSRSFEFNQYQKITGDQSKGLLFKKGEANKILSQTVKDAGYSKMVNGREVIDYEKLADDGRSMYDIQRIARKELESKGYSSAEAREITSAMHEMHQDLFEKVKEYAKAREAGVDKTWLANQNAAPKQTMMEMVKNRIKQSAQYVQITGDMSRGYKFKKGDAKTILGETLKNSDEYGRETKNGNQIDWLKLAQGKPDIDALKAMVSDHLEKEGLRPYDAKLVAEGIHDIYQELQNDIDAHAKSILDARQNALERDNSNNKSDLARLGELHDLGLFNGAHDALLARVLGIDPQDAQAIQGIKVYAEKLSKLRQLLSGNDFIVPSLVHTLNREIHNIIAPLISNKTKTMKAVSALNKLYQLDNSMLISTHGNILENHLSGLMELLTSNTSMRLKLGGELGGMKSQDVALMKDIYAHIAAGGAENGLAPYQVGGTKERLTDEYTIHKMRGADWSKPKTWAKGIATTVLTIPRTFLSGADGSVKAGLMNIHMKGGVIDAMVAASKGAMSHDDAIKIYNDAIYGDGQLDKAKVKAKQLYKDVGLSYVSERELNITAHELLRENLIQDNRIEPDQLNEVMKNAYHQAGLGMGHESNNWVSKKQQAFKKQMNQEESKAVAEHDWDKASKARLVNTVINDVVLRFAASRFNWAWIRAQQAGAGVLTGLYHLSSTNKKYKNIDLLANPEKAQEAAIEYQKGRQELFRGAVGMGISMTAYGVTKAIAKALNPDEEDPTEAMFDQLKDNYAAKALYLKVSPLWLLQSYEYNELKNGEQGQRALGAFGKDFINLTGVGDSHDPSVQFAEAFKNMANKSPKVRAKGEAGLGATFNNFLPHVPLVKQGKNVMSLANWIGGKEASPMPPYPVNFMQGLMGGGVVQDVAGTLKEENLPFEWMQGWGKEE